MKIFGIRVPFTGRRSTAPVPDDRYFAQLLSSEGAGGAVTPQSAVNYTPVFAAIRVIASNLAGLPLVTFEKRKDGGRERATKHPLYKLLKNKPNKRKTTAFEFREMLTLHMLLYGNAYAQIIRNGYGEPLELYPMHPTQVTPELRNGELIYKVRQDNGGSTELPEYEVLHLRAFRDCGLEGLSPIAAAKKAIEAGLSLEDFAKNFFQGGAFPAGVLEYAQGEMPKEARDNLRESWQKLHGGENRGKKVAVLEAGVTWKAMGIPQTDAQFLEQRRFGVEEIARIFGVPPHMLGDLSRCMPADTLVYTEKGPKRIVDVTIGEQVWSLGKEGFELAPVTNFWVNGTEELLEIKTTNRTVRCTAKHRLLVRRAHQIPAVKGVRGGRNVGGKKFHIEWRTEYVEAGNLRVGDTLVALGKLPDLGETVAPNGRQLSVEFMEFCGLLVGDGNVIRQNGKPSIVSIARGQSALYMEHYRTTMRSEFTCGDGGRGGLRRTPTLVEEDRSTKFSSISAAGELASLGFSGTAFTKRVPGWVFGLTEDLRLAFLRGFLDADGTVDGKGRITFYSANEALLADIHHLCVGVGVPVTNMRYDDQVTGPPFTKKIAHTRMFRFTCSDPGGNRRIGSNDPRYVERLSAGKPFGRKGRAYPMFGGKGFDVPGAELSRICSIAHQPAEEVYDIEVEGNHCFIANCLISHNSTNNNIERQSQEFLTYCLRPWMERWEQVIVRDLLDGEDEPYFVKHIANALMRGDSVARGQFYSQGRQWGWFSINDVRELEDMNPIGPEGDVYLSPMNMVPAGDEGKVLEGKEPPQEVPEEESEEEQEESEAKDSDIIRHEAVKDAFRGAFLETWGRVVRKEINAVKNAARKKGDDFDAWFDEFVADHHAFAGECLRELAKGYCTLRGIDTEAALSVLVSDYRTSVRDRVDAWKAEPTRGYDHSEDELATYWAERLLDYSVSNIGQAA